MSQCTSYIKFEKIKANLKRENTQEGWGGMNWMQRKEYVNGDFNAPRKE